MRLIKYKYWYKAKTMTRTNYISKWARLISIPYISRKTTPPKCGMCAQRRLGSVWEFAQYDHGLCFGIEVANKVTFAPSEDTEQPAHMHSLFNFRYAFEG